MALLAMIVTSCDTCTECEIITESNVSEAERKCNGYANSYPNYTIVTSYTTSDCSQRGTIFNEYIKKMCDGVTGITRSRVKCLN